MHPCLSVDEILRLFACELVVSEAKAATVALACCCKSFEEPVLDALWETQYQLTPLLKCFPRDTWKEEGGTFVSLLTAFIHLHCTQPFGLGVFQENPHESRMDALPEACPKNAEAHSGYLRGPRNFGHSSGAATSYRQRPLAPEAQNLRLSGGLGDVYSLHPLIPLPKIHPTFGSFKTLPQCWPHP